MRKSGFVSEISNLSLVYDGDVYGAGFALGISQCEPNETNYSIHDIQITVQGNILPVTDAYWTQNGTLDNTITMAAGFAHRMDGAGVKNIDLHVQGDIGTLDPEKQEHSKTDLIHSFSSGFIYDRTLQSTDSNKNSTQDIQNVSILIDGIHHRGCSPLPRGSGWSWLYHAG